MTKKSVNEINEPTKIIKNEKTRESLKRGFVMKQRSKMKAKKL